MAWVSDSGVVAAGALAVVLLLVAIALEIRLSTQMDSYETALQEAQRDSMELDLEMRSADALRQRQRALQARISAVETVDQNRYAAVHFLDALTSATPSTAWVREIRETGVRAATGDATFEVSGYASDARTLAVFAESLERSPFVRSVTLLQGEASEVNGVGVTAFSIRAETELPDASFLEIENVYGDPLITATPPPASLPQGGARVISASPGPRVTQGGPQ